MTPPTRETPPIASTHDTVNAIVEGSKRKTNFMLRKEFLQSEEPDSETTSAPLADLVSAGDHRALVLYLLLLTTSP